MYKLCAVLLTALFVATPAFAQAWSEYFNDGGAFPWAQIDLYSPSICIGWDYNYNVIDGSDPRGNFSSGDGGAAHIDTDARVAGSGAYDKIMTSPYFTVPAGATLDFIANYRPLGGDSFSVLLSTDGFATWSTLATYTTALGTFPTYPYSSNEPLGAAVSLDLSGYAGQNAQLGFRYAWGGSGGWNWFAQVDNIVVTPEPASLVLLAVAGLVLRRR